MLFSARLPLTSLIDMCRTLRHYLGAGLTLRDVFRQQASKGTGPVRDMAVRISKKLDGGEDLESALDAERAAFPPLFLSMASVGEQTGMLPEIFKELEKYFILQRKLRKQFFTQATWPILQFNAAIFVISGMIFMLAILTPPGSQPFDPLGIGLTGESGAALFILIAYGCVAGLFALYWIITRALRQKAFVDRMLLRIPVIGGCLLSLALTRFCLALRLTLESGMPIRRAAQLTLRATGNAAFESKIGVVKESLQAGEELTASLIKTGQLPYDFQNILAVAEESGRMTEVMQQQCEFYEEESERRLAMLMQMAGWGVWLVVAILILMVVFRIALTYIGMLDPDHPMYH